MGTPAQPTGEVRATGGGVLVVSGIDIANASGTLTADDASTVALGSGAKPADLKGPSGNYRAPLVVKGGTVLVGFNEDALRELL